MEFQKKLHGNADDEEDDEPLILPGFRFSPTDEELLTFYLKRKVENKPTTIELIKHINIYNYEPWDLPKNDEKEMYLFCKRGRKYKNSTRPNRVTRCGFWKATGIDKQICTSRHHCIGLKKTLVYYLGSAGKGTKTDWMMHEFRLPPVTKIVKNNISMEETEVWTVCRIFKREGSISYKKYGWDKKNTPKPRYVNDSCETTTYGVRNNSYETMTYGVRNNAQLLVDTSLSSVGVGDGVGTWDELRPMVDFVLRDHNYNHNHDYDHNYI